MPIASLMDASHTTGIADGIESFFYVILHHAIRFCPHNVNATDFINKTFIPDVQRSDGAILCPMNKELIVAVDGKLTFRRTRVVFYGQPGQTGIRNFPLNRLLLVLLQWLKAQYDVLEYETAVRRSSGSAVASTSNSDCGPSAKVRRVEPRSSNWAIFTTIERPASAEDNSQEEPVRPPQQTYELANCVSAHKAIKELFGQAKSTDWPEDDVVGDQWIRGGPGPFR